jgi:hypothetical protein
VSVILGAYPMLFHATPDEERELYDLLAADPRVGGLELPWVGALHGQGDEWLLDALSQRWSIVLTAVAHTMGTLANDVDYGLASRDSAGRAAALADVSRMAEAVRGINDRAGRRVVRAVELHSAPRIAESDEGALSASLAVAAGLDWDGAELLLEHCDAASITHTPAKGFLPFEQELRAIDGLPVGVLINWGRSAIELRDADRVVEHITRAREAGALRGLFLSGTAATDNAHGAAWADGHLPLAPREPASLLTADLAAAAVAAAGDVLLGAKLSWKGSPTSELRAAALLDAVDALVPSR